MSNLRRRLRKLESRLTDSSGLIPNSQAWLNYWHVKAARILDGLDPDKIPIAYLDAILAAGRKHDGAAGR
jgi:hypothetical protein